MVNSRQLPLVVGQVFYACKQTMGSSQHLNAVGKNRIWFFAFCFVCVLTVLGLKVSP